MTGLGVDLLGMRWALSIWIIHKYKQKRKIKLRSFTSSEHINENGDGPYPGFGYSSLFGYLRKSCLENIIHRYQHETCIRESRVS